MPERTHAGTAERAFAAGAGLVTAAEMAWTLYAAWCAFTNYKFTLTDFGKYTNMLWNTGHGRPFRVLMEYSYLQTHLSFTLAPLGVLFRVWDHPFLLSVVQWLVVMAGVSVLVLTARRVGRGPAECAALALFALVHPYTQSVLLSEFHGVSLYYLLVPWLLHDLLFQRRRAWVPLILLMGVREDAAFLVVPLLLYVAVPPAGARDTRGAWWRSSTESSPAPGCSKPPPAPPSRCGATASVPAPSLPAS